MIWTARNQFYELGFDPSKNRVYFRIFGYWKSPEVVPAYFSDWDKVIALTQPGYTFLADLRNMVTHPAAVKEMHRKIADKLVLTQMSYMAEVSPVDKIAVLQVGVVTQTPGVNHIKVADIVLGEDILDQLSASGR